MRGQGEPAAGGEATARPPGTRFGAAPARRATCCARAGRGLPRKGARVPADNARGWFLPTGSRPGRQACPHRPAGGQRLGNSHEGLTQRAHTGTPPPPHPAQEGAGTFSGRKSPWRLGAEAAGIPATVQ